MEIFIALFIVWLVITVVGHGSWVMVRGLFRIIFAAGERPDPLKDQKAADIAATRRVLGRMAERKLLEPSVARKFRDQLRDLESPPAVNPLRPAPSSQDAAHRAYTVAEAVVSEDVGSEEEVVLATLATDASTMSETPGDAAPTEFGRAPASVPASVPTPPGKALGTPDAAPPLPPTPPAPPVLSRSEVIQSFLAAHNIRWGELAAGILIVVCSIGLVISLWSPLVETHRVIPSLIFLGANAAIYAAGLYTLSRWRLRHTSRAVLVIATLLVPLSVLAGLAAAGTSKDAVRLTDPITLVAIALASLVYVFLLYRGGRALAGRWYAIPIAIAVAGPVAVLPLVPASVRNFAGDAGSVVGIGSLAVMLASIYLVRLRRRVDASIGFASGRARLLVMGFGGFSMAVTIGYAAFALSDFGSMAMLSLAVATIPALVAVAGTSRSLMRSARNSTQSMTGAIVCVIMIGLAWTILPPSMIAASWVWKWALVFSTSAAVVGWLFGQSRWLALATLPVGMAATLSSPIWLGHESWESIPFWNRMIGGEPMLASAMVAAVVAAASRFVRGADRREWIGYAAVFWAVVAMLIAAALSVAPLRTLAVAPWWSVTLVLFVGNAVACVLARRHHVWSLTAIGTTVFTWLSVFRPIQWNAPLASPQTWMMTTVAIAATLLLLRELVPRLTSRHSIEWRVMIRSARTWEHASAVASIAAGVIACFAARQDWVFSAATLASASALLLWASTASRSIDVLRLAQLATAALAVVVGYGQFESWLFAKQAWAGATAIWAWSITAGVVAIGWILIRQLATLNLARLNALRVRRLGFMTTWQAAPRKMLDGWLSYAASALTWFGSSWSFAALLVQAAGRDSVAYESGLFPPLAAFAICGVISGWMLRNRMDRQWSMILASSLVVAGAVWGASQVGWEISADAAGQLIVATTLAVAACFVMSKWAFPRWGVTWSKEVAQLSVVVGPVLVAIASVVLLLVGWLDPILEKTYADRFSTSAVAAWWMMAAVALLWNGKQTRSTSPFVSSAILAPAATALVVPAFLLSHPVVWIQVAAIASVIWAAINRTWLGRRAAFAARPAVDGSMIFALVVGTASALLVTLSIVLDIQLLHPVFGPAGFVISVLATVAWCLGWVKMPKRDDGFNPRLAWPIGLSLLVGQIGWLAYMLGLASGVQVIELVAAILFVASAASLFRSRTGCDDVEWLHVGFVAVAVAIIAGFVGTRSDIMPWFALGALSLAGVQVAIRQWFPASSLQLGLSRLLGWIVIVVGGMFLVMRIASAASTPAVWTLLIVWPALWVVVWRLVCRETRDDRAIASRAGMAIPDMEFAALLMLAVVGETALFALSGRHNFQTTVLGDPLLWGRMAAYLAVAASTLTARAVT